MTKKIATLFFCKSCGVEYRQWEGKCRACGDWNSIIEAPTPTLSPVGGFQQAKTSKIRGNHDSANLFTPLGLSDTITEEYLPTGMDEFDRTIGGGIVPGGVTLISGDPGIGKSTLILQITGLLAKNKKCVYISGEESPHQINLRAKRLNIPNGSMQLASHYDCDVLLQALDQVKPDFVVIDSIQTLASGQAQGAPGSITQIRTITQMLVHYAKANHCAMMLVGHVTKEGNIAGPRLLEHMVDTVLYLEGDKNQYYRLLRTIKNRFGATDETGIFDLRQDGMHEVPNPSAIFTSNENIDSPGKAVCVTTTGTRPLMVDIQALVASSIYPMPKRTALGFDSARLDMIIAILENHAGYVFAGHDIYLNVAGGLKIREPAADLAAAAALISALLGRALPHNISFAGELGLSGEVRAVNLWELRVKEAKKMGFVKVILPPPILLNDADDVTTKDKFIDIMRSVHQFPSLMKDLS
ncbi:MAG: DNA repair protein RadA [Alphaproteobacteria bacterium]|nr:DNA repair protein RadA [Alphaproteobacteria bacterium]